MTKEIEDKQNLLNIRIQNKNPKKNPITYEIRTMQDIADCITSENIHGFLKDFEMCLHTYLLATAITNASIKESRTPIGTTIKFPSFTWIDDWKPKKTRKSTLKTKN